MDFSIPKLSLFRVERYEQKRAHIYDCTGFSAPFYTLAHIIEGSVRFNFDNELVDLEKGDSVFIPVNSRYVSEWDKTMETVCISMHFDFEVPSPFLNGSDVKIQRIYLKEEETLLFEKCHTLYRENEEIKFSALGLFYTVMGRVYPMIKFEKKPHIDERIKKVSDYIERNFAKEIQLSELLKIANMSESHFYSCFKKQLGYTALEYKHLTMVRHAIPLLIDNKLSIEEISGLAGFNSAAYFREIFKKLTGKSPREYKKQI